MAVLDTRLRMVDIAALLHIGKSAVTKMVDRLEQRGLLVREYDLGDRRAICASLTKLGQKTFVTARPAFLAAVQRHFSGQLNQTELAHLRRTSRQVLADPD